MEEHRQESDKKPSNERFYWLKLKKGFFKRHDIKVIEGMPNGKDYVLFYLKLLCESLDHNGNLRFSDTIPYSDTMLASVTDTNIDVVRSAMKILISLNLVEILDDQTIFMNEVEKMTGSETASTIRSRECRARQAEQDMLQCNNTQQNATQEIRDKKEENRVLVNGGKENNNTTSARACACACTSAREDRKLTVEQFEQEIGCVGWAAFPNGDVYAEIRDVLIELINVGEVTMWEIDRAVLGEIQGSLFKGREQRSINNLRAYIVSILNRKRKERRGEQ